MKLSHKFFCIAYIVALLATGLGGTVIIKHINDTLWNTRIERVNTAVNYAMDSFYAFADVSYEGISANYKSEITREIEETLEGTVADVKIYTEPDMEEEYTQLEDNGCLYTFVKEDNLLLMKSVSKMSIEPDSYYMVIHSDFSDIQAQCNTFWSIYGIVVFGISVMSGLLLFIMTKKITRPLNQLANVTDEIAMGNYGKNVDIKSSDYEINALSDSFNTMSAAVCQKMNEIKEEVKKRDIFVADFTHELKTPMTAIIGYSQMINSYELDENERDEAAVAIYNEAKRLEKLSLQLLDLYVYQNEKAELEYLNLKLIGEQVSDTLKHLSKKYQVSYSVDFEEDVVWGNEVLLLSLLYNLSDNGFKASNSDGEVKIYSKAREDLVWIYVEDKGRGIEKENIKYLTEPFFREDKSRSRKLGGAGLGLSLCKEIAKLHETELCFESEKNRGTTVYFALKKGGGENE